MRLLHIFCEIETGSLKSLSFRICKINVTLHIEIGTTDGLARIKINKNYCACTQGSYKHNVYRTYRFCSTLTEFRVYYVMRLRAYMLFLIIAVYYLYRLWSQYLYNRASPLKKGSQIQSTVISFMSAQNQIQNQNQNQILVSRSKIVLVVRSSTGTITGVKLVNSAIWCIL
jgi:hypothetical protein